MIVKRFDMQFGTVQCAVSLFDSATVVARPALNESAQLGSSTILECRVPRCTGKCHVTPAILSRDSDARQSRSVRLHSRTLGL